MDDGYDFDFIRLYSVNETIARYEDFPDILSATFWHYSSAVR